MTAEIAILNPEAVALAADSAVTMTTELGPKVYQSANKIFGLSLSAPIALMVYDSAKFLGVPWETIVKTYRKERGDQSWATLEEHTEDFLDFIRSSELLFPASARQRCAEQTVLMLFIGMRDELDRRIGARLDAQGTITEGEIRGMLEEFTKEVAQYLGSGKRLRGAPRARDMTAAIRPAVRRAREAAFEQLPMSRTDIARLTRIATAALIRDVPLPVRPPNRSGVVIAGFGSDQIYPEIREVVLEALVERTLKVVHYRHTAISPSDTEAVIIPFAQREIVDAFIGGIEPGFSDFIHDYWQKSLDALASDVVSGSGISGHAATAVAGVIEQCCRDRLNEFTDDVDAKRHFEYAAPILGAVAMLPKDELGAMAEAFVNLTSFKRKVSIEAETVGGPIDVAVISKGDGLIWIKRKHYFDPRLNPQYFATRFGGIRANG